MKKCNAHHAPLDQCEPCRPELLRWLSFLCEVELSKPRPIKKGPGEVALPGPVQGKV